MTNIGRARLPSPGAASGSRKALIILDQVPFEALEEHACRLKTHKKFSAVELGFIPRTTPVGHATISLGKMPCEHRVQGREWMRRDGSSNARENIELLQSYPPPKPQAHSVLSDDLRQAISDVCIAAELRRAAPDAPIVVASGKGFVSYLLGINHADILIFPSSTLPAWVHGRWRMTTVILPQSQVAREMLNASDTQRRLWRIFNAHAFHFDELESSWAAPEGPREALEFHWLLPDDWARAHQSLVARRSVAAAWVDYMDHRWSRVDDLIQAVALECLLELERAQKSTSGTMIQSRFATDTHGHLYGVGHERYAQTLIDALSSLERLVDDEMFAHVAVTSDHGGRPIATPITFDQVRRSTMPPMQLPDAAHTETLFKSGDHLVGYSSKWPEQTDVQVWTCGGLQSVDLGTLIEDSFHPEQRPSSLILPTADSGFVSESLDGLQFSRRGEHGAGVELSDQGVKVVDGLVPVLHLSASALAAPSGMPTHLSEVRDWFVGL